MATETYSQIQSWIDSIFKSNGRKFITGAHANEGFKKVLAKAEELFTSKGAENGIATLGEDGKVLAAQLPAVESGGGSAYLLTLSENPTYNTDGSVKIMKEIYVDDATKFYEERFEYTNGFVSKIEIKDDMNGTWVQKTDIYNASGQIQKPTITVITEWTII